MKIVDLEKYRTTKQISGKSAEIKEYLTRLNDFFEENYGDKSWGWVGTTALLYSHLALVNYMSEENADKRLIPVLKRVLWNFQHLLNCSEENGKDK